MKRVFTKFGSICIVMLILMASVTTAFAEDSLKINGADTAVSKGDTLKFTLNLSDTTEDVYGFELRLFYDPEKLELIKGSVESETFDSIFYNEDISGKLPLNWTDISNPVDCSKKTPFFSCNFKVLDGGDTKISYFVTELYGDDMTYLKSYTWTYDLTDGDAPVVSDGVLPISDDEETLNNRQSNFINYVDGKGEENSPNKDNHESVVGRIPTTQIVNEVVDVTRYEDVDNNNGGKSGGSPWIFVIIAVPIIAALIIIAVVLANRKSKKAAETGDYGVEEPKFDPSAEMQAMEEIGESDDEN